MQEETPGALGHEEYRSVWLEQRISDYELGDDRLNFVQVLHLFLEGLGGCDGLGGETDWN